MRTGWSGVLAAVLCAAPAGATAAPLPCPARISTKQELAQPLEGWQWYATATSHALDAVSIFDGHPSRQVSLKYDRAHARKGRRVQVWHLARGKEYWITCGYEGTSVAVMHALPAGLRQCEVVWAGRYTEVVGVSCR